MIHVLDASAKELPGWPIVISSRAAGTCSYAEIPADDFDDDGILDQDVPMEGRYFLFGLAHSSAGAAGWGYRGHVAATRWTVTTIFIN